MKLLVVLACVAFAAASHGQVRPKAKPSTGPVAFDPATTKVPATLTGGNCLVLANMVKGLAPPKTEFESAAQYEQRLQGIGDTKFGANFKASDLLAYPLSEYDVEMRYDAERGKAVIGVRRGALLNAWVGQTSYPAFTVQAVTSTSRKFAAMNGFGARTVVEETHSVRCSLAIANKAAHWIPGYSEVEISLDGPSAAALKPNLGGLAIVRLAPPYYAEVSGGYQATITSPTQLVISGPAVVAELVDLWYYNRKTGDVAAQVETIRYGKFPAPPASLSGGAPEPASK